MTTERQEVTAFRKAFEAAGSGLRGGSRLLRTAAKASALMAGCLTAVLAAGASAGVLAGALLASPVSAQLCRGKDCSVPAVQELAPKARAMLQADAGDEDEAGGMAETALAMAREDPEACASLLGVDVQEMGSRELRMAAEMLLEEGDWLGPAHPRLLLLRRMRQASDGFVPGRPSWQKMQAGMPF